jgi:hypothetical protein
MDILIKIKRYQSLFYLFILFFCQSILSAQTNNRVIGYENITWGASIQVVQQAYQNLSERESKNSNIGVREFQQNIYANGIISRVFYFFQNQLYRVTVNYDTLNNINSRAGDISNNIINIYGPFDRQNNMGGGVDAYLFNENYYIWNYNDRLKIEMRWGNTLAYDYFVGVFLICIYSNPITENEIEVAKVRLRQNDNNREYVIPY